MELSVNGDKVFAATGGRVFDGALPVVCFLHGAGLDHSVWSLQARYLARHGRAVLAVDMPGHGGSEGAPLSSIAEMADWVASFLDAAGVEKAALVGHSMGALVAIEAAVRGPELIGALVLLGAAETMPVHPDLLAAARENDPLAARLITSWGHAGDAKVGGHPSPGLWMVGGATRLLERSRPGTLYTDLKACADYGSAAPAANRVACPTVLVLGAADMMTPCAKGEALAAAIEGAATVVLPGCGHMVMVERPDATTDALRKVL
jgi:pimeloyl-ACP methyl ester carboxylesterase